MHPTRFALVARYPNDVTTLVAHEPPLIPVLPDAEAAERAQAGFRDAYMAKGRGAGMAAFIAMTSWRGECTGDYFAQPAPDPAQYGMPAEDDGSREICGNPIAGASVRQGHIAQPLTKADLTPVWRVPG